MYKLKVFFILSFLLFPSSSWAGRLFPPQNEASCVSGSALVWNGDGIECKMVKPMVTMNCSSGRYMKGIDTSGNPVCIKFPKPSINYGSCKVIHWTSHHTGNCPKGYVLTGANYRNSDSGEWNSFICCKLK